MSIFKRCIYFCLLNGLVLLVSTASMANNAIFTVQLEGTQITFVLSGSRIQSTPTRLTITGPEDFTAVTEFTADQPIEFDIGNAALVDGQYNYEVQLLLSGNQRTNTVAGDSRKTGLPRQSGIFTITNGFLVTPDSNENSTRVSFFDDVIVQASLCVGLDCVNNQTFPESTNVQLRENNNRILFDDTSNSASFPTNDWQLIANDSNNGGGNLFAIADFTSDRRLLTLEAGAPENAIFLDNSGNIGFGTSTPLLDLHTSSANTPAFRLEQNGSGGFPAQSWDMGGNELEFFIRDATSFSIPLSIETGAPNDSLIIDSNGDVILAGDLITSTPPSLPGIAIPAESNTAGFLSAAKKQGIPTAMSLAEISEFIQNNQQLPGFTDNADGHHVIEFQLQLLQTIQELTLHTIEQQEKIDALQTRLSSLERKR